MKSAIVPLIAINLIIAISGCAIDRTILNADVPLKVTGVVKEDLYIMECEARNIKGKKVYIYLASDSGLMVGHLIPLR